MLSLLTAGNCMSVIKSTKMFRIITTIMYLAWQFKIDYGQGHFPLIKPILYFHLLNPLRLFSIVKFN